MFICETLLKRSKIIMLIVIDWIRERITIGTIINGTIYSSQYPGQLSDRSDPDQVYCEAVDPENDCQ